MKVVVPYTRLHPDTLAALEADRIEARFVDTSADVEAYWRLLRDLWAERETFVLVEHDNVPVPGAIKAIWECEHPWCSYPYPVGGAWEIPCLGCAKFSGGLQASFPDLLERVGTTYMGLIDGERVTGSDWHRLDMTLSLLLARRRGPVHWHPAGMVGHRHVYATAAETA